MVESYNGLYSEGSRVASFRCEDTDYQVLMKSETEKTGLDLFDVLYSIITRTRELVAYYTLLVSSDGSSLFYMWAV